MKITIKQLRYILATNEAGSITDAAALMSVSQPTLSGAIGQVEKELGFDIFVRHGSGVMLTEEGRQFVRYAQRVVQEMDNLERHYGVEVHNKIRFNIVTQRLAFAEFAFIEVAKKVDRSRYDFSIDHKRTFSEIIEDVASGAADLGLFVVFDDTYRMVENLAHESNLEVVKLFSRRPHAMMAATHPLANRDSVSFKDLEPYPRIATNDANPNSDKVLKDNMISVTSSLVLTYFYNELNGYSIWVNLMPEYLERNTVGVPIKTKEMMDIAYVVPSGVSRTDVELLFIDELMKYKDT